VFNTITAGGYCLFLPVFKVFVDFLLKAGFLLLGQGVNGYDILQQTDTHRAGYTTYTGLFQNRSHTRMFFQDILNCRSPKPLISCMVRSSRPLL